MTNDQYTIYAFECNKNINKPVKCTVYGVHLPPVFLSITMCAIKCNEYNKQVTWNFQTANMTIWLVWYMMTLTMPEYVSVWEQVRTNEKNTARMIE